MITIDIDTGGTFTDGYFYVNGIVEKVKVNTTPHDLTVCFRNCLEEGAKKLNFRDLPSLLKETDVIRFCTTVGLNSLIQKTGPKLGLIVSSCQEPVFQEISLPILFPEMVMGISGKVDSKGNILEEVNPEEVRETVKNLLIRGARTIVISLENAMFNLSHETEVKRIIEEDYPKHCLGAIPVLTTTSVNLSNDYVKRTNAALLNAYMHHELARFLYKAEDDLREALYPRPLLIVHNWGGAARVAKTKAINTYASGPTAALHGTAHLSSVYKGINSVYMDVGGTSADFGFIQNGNIPQRLQSDFQGIPTDVPMVETFSVGAGGGSIAFLQDNHLKVGPKSAGALPGPVCYDLGGNEPTATDACLVLGYIDPDYFLGGRKKLKTEAAIKSLEKRIASPLGITVEEAALQIFQEQSKSMSSHLLHLLDNQGLSGQDTVLFSLGGAGGLYCNAVADLSTINKILIPPFASVFSAFGSSVMDIAHEYEAPARAVLRSVTGEYQDRSTTINQIIQNLKQRAWFDMQGEGFSSEDVEFTLKIFIACLDKYWYVEFPVAEWRGVIDAQVACIKMGETDGESSAHGEVVLTNIKLQARCRLKHAELPKYPYTREDATSARKGKRMVSWKGGKIETSVYDQKLLSCGNVIKGPAIIEAEDTVVLVPEGKKYSIDEHLFGVLEKM